MGLENEVKTLQLENKWLRDLVVNKAECVPCPLNAPLLRARTVADKSSPHLRSSLQSGGRKEACCRSGGGGRRQLEEGEDRGGSRVVDRDPGVGVKATRRLAMVRVVNFIVCIVLQESAGCSDSDRVPPVEHRASSKSPCSCLYFFRDCSSRSTALASTARSLSARPVASPA